MMAVILTFLSLVFPFKMGELKNDRYAIFIEQFEGGKLTGVVIISADFLRNLSGTVEIGGVKIEKEKLKDVTNNEGTILEVNDNKGNVKLRISVRKYEFPKKIERKSPTCLILETKEYSVRIPFDGLKLLKELGIMSLGDELFEKEGVYYIYIRDDRQNSEVWLYAQ